jgi:hypothetical protein
MKKIILAAALAALSFAGSASASVLTGDTVTLTFRPLSYSLQFVVGDGTDLTVNNFQFDLNGGADGNRFIFTTANDGDFVGRTSVTLSGLDFTDKSVLTGFDLVSTSLTDFLFTTTADSITFNFSDAFARQGTVIDGFFETAASSSQVPLPGTLPLLALGLGALYAGARVRRSAARG